MNQTQREINEAERRNPDNWGGIGPFKAYFSKRDSRIFVPRFYKFPLAPSAINHGHRFGTLVLFAITTFITVVWLCLLFAPMRH